MDTLFADTLQKLYSNGLLENTLLLVMSDHGYRFGDVRSTTSGWFEDKLPMMYVKLGNKLAKDHSDWLNALESNSKSVKYQII